MVKTIARGSGGVKGKMDLTTKRERQTRRDSYDIRTDSSALWSADFQSAYRVPRYKNRYTLQPPPFGFRLLGLGISLELDLQSYQNSVTQPPLPQRQSCLFVPDRAWHTTTTGAPICNRLTAVVVLSRRSTAKADQVPGRQSIPTYSNLCGGMSAGQLEAQHSKLMKLPHVDSHKLFVAPCK